MSDPMTERIELEPQTAVALRNWLITVSQRLGLDPETIAETPTPPSTAPPAAIAPIFGELALRLDAICTPTADTVTVHVHAVPSPDWAEPASPSSQRRALDDRAVTADDDQALDHRCGGVPDLVDVHESAATSSDPPGPQPHDDHSEHAGHLPAHIWAATPTRSTTPLSEDDNVE